MNAIVYKRLKCSSKQDVVKKNTVINFCLSASLCNTKETAFSHLCHVDVLAACCVFVLAFIFILSFHCSNREILRESDFQQWSLVNQRRTHDA